LDTDQGLEALDWKSWDLDHIIENQEVGLGILGVVGSEESFMETTFWVVVLQPFLS